MNYNNFKFVNNKFFFIEQSMDSIVLFEYSLDYICYFNEYCIVCVLVVSNVNVCVCVYVCGIYFDLRGDRCCFLF